MTPSNRTYKVFVSSTFEDLIAHRAHVIAQLRRAQFYVDPMEDWPADSDEPKRFSQDRLADCHLCILLVAFRRGYVPEGETRSITQLEYDAAVKQGIDILPFLLDENEPWSRKFDELEKDSELRTWRNYLSNKHGRELFKQDPSSIDMTGALSRWLKKQQAVQSESRFSHPEPVPSTPVEMVKVPKGPFLYGLERGRQMIEYDFLIAKYPVTNGQYGKFILANGYEQEAYWSPEGWKWKSDRSIIIPEYWKDPTWNKLDHPVVGVSYYEAEAYAKWIGKRLPTEQEWEKAARGEDGRQYPWGEDFDESKCNGFKSGIGHTTPVSQYPNGVSPYGCHDMTGNVSEWCASRYDGEKKDNCVFRGSAFNSPLGYEQIPNRGTSYAPYRNFNLGFRLAEDIL